MFKILVIQATNNLSDERAEFLINDRLSFMRFLGLGLEDRVPDARTVWLFREKLTTAGAIKRLFEQSDAMLRQLYLPAQDRHRMTGLCYARRPIRTHYPIAIRLKSIAGVRGPPSR